ncbi:helix-turn-helix domain-containing protein [Actinoplanes sp. CA-030573]|uniref:helix-turn-helix domain-containing protein n=1 Tax=Actinoplanes sp. CA-030573 TaxID=3239898 RepID=UPI003D91F00D
MRLSNVQELGRYLRDRRRAVGLSQGALADRATVSRRWLTDLEAGKATAEVGLVFKVISALGLYVEVRPTPEPGPDLDALLDSMGNE